MPSAAISMCRVAPMTMVAALPVAIALTIMIAPPSALIIWGSQAKLATVTAVQTAGTTIPAPRIIPREARKLC